MPKKLIGEILIEKNLVTAEQFKHALDTQATTGKRIGDILVELEYISRGELEKILGTDVVDLAELEISPEILALIPDSYAKKYNVIPIRKKENKLVIAMEDSANFTVTDDIEFMVRCPVEVVVCSREDIQNAIRVYYGHESDEAAIEEKEYKDQFNQEITNIADQIFQAGEEEAPITKFVTLLITEAIKRRASDIHLEPLSSSFRVRYRIDGVLHDVSSPPVKLQGPVISRIKLMAGMDIAEKRLPQDGRIKFAFSKEDIDLRVSTLPGVHGESVVLRILDKTNILIGLHELGFMKDDEEIFERLLNIPNGIILVTGPTGSGKTTSLYASLQYINRPDRKLITVEDPVEYQITGINQVQVKDSIDLTFAKALRAILRQSPDAIMIGEIRDYETAAITIQAALTGHLVFSTLHTNDAASAIIRLIDMEVPPYLVSSSVSAIIAQRLVRRICEKCKESYDPSPNEVISLGLKDQKVEKLYRGKGCEECSYTGYKGRLGIFEILIINEKIRSMIFENSLSADIREAAKSFGMHTLLEDGVRKMLAGATTVNEVLRVTQVE